MRLNQLLVESNAPPLPPQQEEQFASYLTLLQKWNARTNLTAIRDEEGILSRHFLESILCAHSLDENVSISRVSTLLDFGSGAGFPGIPIAIIRPEIAVTLAESQNKKAAFLREAIRTLNLSNVAVHAGRAETLPFRFNVVTLRAVDNIAEAIPAAAQLLAPLGHLAILTTTAESPTVQQLAGPTFLWQTPTPLPAGSSRILLLGRQS